MPRPQHYNESCINFSESFTDQENSSCWGNIDSRTRRCSVRWFISTTSRMRRGHWTSWGVIGGDSRTIIIRSTIIIVHWGVAPWQSSLDCTARFSALLDLDSLRGGPCCCAVRPVSTDRARLCVGATGLECRGWGSAISASLFGKQSQDRHSSSSSRWWPERSHCQWAQN